MKYRTQSAPEEDRSVFIDGDNLRIALRHAASILLESRVHFLDAEGIVNDIDDS
jgi:hypothetical protein